MNKEQEQNNQDKAIKDAQYRKSLSISYFNSLNAAIELVKDIDDVGTEYDLKNTISRWRDWFIDEHAKYYNEVVQKVGLNYDPEESIKKLEATSNLKELNNVWVSFSEDERQDDEIRKVASKMKKEHE